MPGTSTGTGVAHVRVLAYLNGTGSPINLGDATYGLARTDVQTAFQAHATGFTPSGFAMQVRGLAPGTYRLEAQAFSSVTQSYNQTRDITVTVTANPGGWIDVPAPASAQNQQFTIMGWALDLAAGSGTGVSTVHLWVVPNPGSGMPAQFLGAATYGASRPDVAAVHGTQFLNSGYSLAATLAPGTYQLQAYAWSTVLNTWATAQTSTFTVASSTPLIAIETPANGGTTGQPFWVAGWAIDVGAPSGTGVDVVHVYAVSNGGSGTSTFLGAATYGGARPDVGAAYGPQFTNSSYGLLVNGLAPGYYQINVYAHSTVTPAGSPWPVQTIYVTVQ